MKIFQKPETIQSILNNSQPCRAGGFLLRVKGSKNSYNQILIIIPKKKVKSSVIRNRIRRCAREAIQSLYKEFKNYKNEQNYDIILVLYENLGEISTSNYRNKFINCWQSSIN